MQSLPEESVQLLLGRPVIIENYKFFCLSADEDCRYYRGSRTDSVSIATFQFIKNLDTVIECSRHLPVSYSLAMSSCACLPPVAAASEPPLPQRSQIAALRNDAAGAPASLRSPRHDAVPASLSGRCCGPAAMRPGAGIRASPPARASDCLSDRRSLPFATAWRARLRPASLRSAVAEA